MQENSISERINTGLVGERKVSMNYEIIRLADRPEIMEQAAEWFHEKWNIPLAEYRKSMKESLTKENVVPQWYVAMEGKRIIGGLGVIENDFHDRKDLTPNVCAVYTEEDKRCSGVAGALLNYVCADMKENGIETLYLVTDHHSFYERYGWEFLCMVQGDEEPDMTRMYIHREALVIRKYRPSDCERLAELFYQTVHAVNARDYTKEQLDAWASGCVDLEKWNQSFEEHHTVVAVKNNVIAGFGDIDESGYLDRLYVHKDYQKQGIAAAICDELEKSVMADRITTHASITAKSFFEHRGYRAVREQQVLRDGISLTNFMMEK